MTLGTSTSGLSLRQRLRAYGISPRKSLGQNFLVDDSLAQHIVVLAGVQPPDTVIEIGTDTTRAIAGLLFSGAAARYPDMNIIFSHGGGTLPFLIERFTRLAQRKQLAARLPRGILQEIERFYYDVAQIAYPAPMAALMKLVPVTQILFGTDFTFRTAAEIADGLQACNLSARVHKAINRDNALRLFPRFRHVMA